jgi:hypothetical protein
MEKQRVIWLLMKGLAFACIGAIIYNLVCLKGV